ncbi:hypothetical protein BT63DRAFT_450441 [Microthyrium microscopicum]|uniref:C2H2-type domain-containing protein n=1 Tax=Microthyrium microscopicum TaxID=703497 RepID=A0A6A6UVE5_9PEZI|nr:hypothetical protein BT63DRAFT_450441 [Microthyrium microscopicum]
MDGARNDSFRRRSPDGYDRRNRGPRSRSPPNIDRYQPGDRPTRDDHYRKPRDDAHRRGRSPPPVQAGIDRYVPGHEPPPMTSNPLQNPMNLDFQVGFTYFAEWWRVDQQIKEERERAKNGGRRDTRVKSEKESREERVKQKDQIQAAYDAYKEKLQIQMARQFVTQHKGEEWFKEKYIPEVRDEFRPRMFELRREAYERWAHDLDHGVFDEFTLEGIYKNDSNGAGGVVEKEEGEATAANEVLGVGDLLPSRGGEIRDEAANLPTLLIKTIAPTVSRIKMEAFCKEHLGDSEGGFKWLSLSDPNPQKKYHRIGWVMLNPSTSDSAKVDDRGDGRDEDEEMEDGAVKSENGDTTTNSVATKALAELNGKTIKDEERGDFTCHVGIHEPPGAPRKKALWDLFSAPERVERDLELAVQIANKFDAEMGEEYHGTSKVDEQVENLRGKGWLQPPVVAAPPKKVKDDIDMDEEEEEGAIEEEDEPSLDDEVDDEELLAKKKRLDLLVEYLRRVHNFCLFCVFESDSVHELIRKCPGGHLRRPRASLTTAAKTAAKASAQGQLFPFKKADGSDGSNESNGSPVDEKKHKPTGRNQQQLQRAFNWVKTYEDKIVQLLDPDSVDVAKMGGKSVESGLEEELNKYVKQEDENKWRCKVPECTKLFKGSVFWRKHVEKRHEDFYEKLKQDILLVNAYVLDPAHIAPSRSDANSNGHFPLNQHGQQGTPRGFNLSNMQQFGFPGLANNNFPPNPMQMALLAMNNSNTFPGADDDRSGVGPIRRGTGRFNNRNPGPYDRPKQDSRNPRPYGGAGGRLSPPRGNPGNVRPPPARFADGQGPSSRESVQGRSLKSYEDLDAAGGGGTGALDY